MQKNWKIVHAITKSQDFKVTKLQKVVKPRVIRGIDNPSTNRTAKSNGDVWVKLSKVNYLIKLTMNVAKNRGETKHGPAAHEHKCSTLLF